MNTASKRKPRSPGSNKCEVHFDIPFKAVRFGQNPDSAFGPGASQPRPPNVCAAATTESCNPRSKRSTSAAKLHMLPPSQVRTPTKMSPNRSKRIGATPPNHSVVHGGLVVCTRWLRHRSRWTQRDQRDICVANTARHRKAAWRPARQTEYSCRASPLHFRARYFARHCRLTPSHQYGATPGDLSAEGALD